MDIAAIARYREEPAGGAEDLESISSTLFTRSLNAGKSPIPIVKVLLRQLMAGSTEGTVHFFKNLSKVYCCEKCLFGVDNSFANSHQKIGCNSEITGKYFFSWLTPGPRLVTLGTTKSGYAKTCLNM